MLAKKFGQKEIVFDKIELVKSFVESRFIVRCELTDIHWCLFYFIIGSIVCKEKKNQLKRDIMRMCEN